VEKSSDLSAASQVGIFFLLQLPVCMMLDPYLNPLLKVNISYKEL